MNAWQQVGDALRELSSMCGASGEKPSDMMKFAKTYERFAALYVEAIGSEGRTSMRAEAAAKAMSLGTPKSKILAFLEREGTGTS